MAVFNYLSDHWVELIGFVFGIVYVVLIIREHAWGWVAGSINVMIYIVVFYQSGLYGMSLLQVFYLLVSIYGFLLWRGHLPSKNQNRIEKIRNMPVNIGWLLTLSVFAASLLAGYMLSITDSPVPRIDGLTTVLGLAATWMTARKYIENWLVWIINDLICVVIYAYLGLYLTTALYFVFLVMAVVGYVAWRKKMELQKG